VRDKEIQTVVRDTRLHSGEWYRYADAGVQVSEGYKVAG